MNKEQTIMEYFIGIRNYTSFYVGKFDKSQYIKLSDLTINNILSAQVSILSCLMFLVKEDIVDKIANDLTINNKILSQRISRIVLKVKDGYKIGDYVFSDISTLLSVIRNKLAHGDFIIDYDNKKIRMNYDNAVISIKIKSLSELIIGCYQALLNSADVRNIFLYTAVGNRKSRMQKESEIRRTIDNFECMHIVFARKDGTKIDERRMDKFNIAVNNYQNTQDCKFLYEFEKNELNDEYIFDYKVLAPNVSTQDKDDIVRAILSEKDITYLEQLNFIGNSLLLLANNEIKSMILLVDNLIILESMYNNYGSDFDTCLNWIQEKYPNDTFDSSMIYLAGIAGFNSLFSYAFDDVYKNENLYTNGDNTGLEYDKLDLSKFDITYVDYNDSAINELRIKVKAKEKGLLEKQEKEKELRKSYSIVKNNGNTRAMNTIFNSLSSITKEIININLEYLMLKNELDDKLMHYHGSNKGYFENKKIIEGIRNSIAHGNYEITDIFDIGKCRIVFRDVYNEKLTFLASINFLDFMQMLEDTIPILQSFITQNYGKVRSK